MQQQQQQTQQRNNNNNHPAMTPCVVILYTNTALPVLVYNNTNVGTIISLH